MELRVNQISKFTGETEVPGDKSISHRAVMLGAIARGTTTVKNFLVGADCLSTMECFRAMGTDFEHQQDGTMVIRGNGLYGLKEPGDVLNVGNSGTTIRLMMGILSGQSFFTAITGDASIRKRPMARVISPLKEMGAVIMGRDNGNLAPIAIQGGRVNPISYVSPVSSAQVKSAVLLAGLYAAGKTVVGEPTRSRDHTERMLAYLGADIKVGENTVEVAGGSELTGKPVEVPGDISSAAFLMVGAAIVPDSSIIIKRVGINPTRTGIIDVLKGMGADLRVVNEKEINGEPVGDIVVRGGKRLKGTVIEGEIIPRLIDEIPVLAVAAAVADGETVIRDASELKVKESNRITTVAGELSKMKVCITETPDGMIIKGGTRLAGAVCDSHGDHRIAMAAAIAGLAAKGETIIKNSECIDVSFPGFETTLRRLNV